MNYSYIPQKVKVKRPIYSNIQRCPTCLLCNNFPLYNMTGSPRHCMVCKNVFDAQIVGYEDYIEEKIID